MKQFSKNPNACAHTWAHALQPAGKAGNMFFNGKTIYSYGMHFPIATIEGNYVFFTTQSYSVTTSQHKSIVRSAVSHKHIVYVHFVPENNNYKRDKDFHNRNIKYWIKELNNNLAFLHAHPRKKSILDAISRDHKRLCDFVNAIGIKPNNKLQSILNDVSLNAIKSFLQAGQKLKSDQQRRIVVRLKNEFLLNVEKWRKGEINRLHYNHSIGNQNTYLRINSETERVETSKGIEIPRETAFRFWKYINHKLPDGCTQCDYKILDFNVDEISSSFIRVGCHNIEMEEAKRIATLFKWKF